MRACWLKWVGRDWSISADYIWLNYSGANKYSEVIGPDGSLYKCWNEIGYSDRSYGSIFENVTSSASEVSIWNAYDFCSDSECLNCSLLPMCMGGCPFTRLYENKTSCVSARKNCIKVMRAAYDLKHKK